MANKKITDLQLRDNVSAELSFPCDDTLQSYRVTSAQILAYITANITLHTTGDLKPTLKTVADTGWVMCNDGTIGNAASGATTRANADTEALYTLLWNNIDNAHAPVTGGRGASAAADYAANKPIALTKMLGRALGISGAGSTLTARALGSVVGAETHTLLISEMPTHTHTQNAHQHVGRGGTNVDVGLGQATRLRLEGGGYNGIAQSGADAAHPHTRNISDATNQPATATNNNEGGGGAHNNMQPTTFVNVMIKL